MVSLYTNLKGQVKLHSSFIDIDCTINDRGRVNFECETTYPYASGASLEFQIDTDQSFLPETIQGLKGIIDAIEKSNY